ncbi:cysteine dioxygenase [Streptomyces sp. NBC_01433]|uniref:cysteine dioxygenase n=1 Tax=Streptomyces sp. NBC_01433 TaxID=2903864 RepID=UPI002254A99E|nr:cysteine dioxygenase [Streptomyces sp. NBC_01433]MCX4673821.1 cysteine dioxygenase [Streptomyces sp. NBC_01433]
MSAPSASVTTAASDSPSGAGSPHVSDSPSGATDLSGSAVSAVSASGTPAGPGVTELLDFVRRTAQDTALIGSLPLDPEGRTWVRLAGPGGSEAWLIGWPPGTGTGWHDHADSIGAFTTAAGTLREHSLAARLPTDGWKTLELSEGVDRARELTTGQGRAFGQHHVHEVLNESDSEHAVSVHAYYPPLPRIRRYSRAGAVLRLEQTERPEDWQ